MICVHVSKFNSLLLFRDIHYMCGRKEKETAYLEN